MKKDKNISDFSVKYKRPEGLVPQRRVFGPGCSVNWSGQTEKLCGRCSIVRELAPLGHMSELVMLYLVNKMIFESTVALHRSHSCHQIFSKGLQKLFSPLQSECFCSHIQGDLVFTLVFASM